MIDDEDEDDEEEEDEEEEEEVDPDAPPSPSASPPPSPILGTLKSRPTTLNLTTAVSQVYVNINKTTVCHVQNIQVSLIHFCPFYFVVVIRIH